MQGDLLSSGIGAEKFSFKKLQKDYGAKDASQLNSDYNYFSDLQAGVAKGDVEAAQQAMGISLFSVKNDGSDNAKNLERNNATLIQIQSSAKNVINEAKTNKESSGQSGEQNFNQGAQNGQLAPSIENVNEIKKILQEQGDDDITEEDIRAFLENSEEYNE